MARTRNIGIYVGRQDSELIPSPSTAVPNGYHTALITAGMVERDVSVPPEGSRALAALELLSRKWSPVILLRLQSHGPQGYNELLESMPDISSKVLSNTLETLQEAELVDRRVVNESPLRVEYGRTTASQELEPVFASLSEWADAHLTDVSATVLLADSDRRVSEMYSQLLSDRYAVRQAHTSEQLADRFNDQVDVLLLDVGIPGVDPTAFLGFDTQCRTVLLVGDRPEIELLATDCDAILRKPFVRETAIAVIDDQLSRHGEPRRARKEASIAARTSAFESIYGKERLTANDTYRELQDGLNATDTEKME